MVRQTPIRTRTTDPATRVVHEPATLEAQLHTIEGRLAQLKAQVRQAQQLAGLGTVAATIAHEVSNLLTPIRSYVETALQEDDHELQKKALTVTLKNVRILVAMCDRVLEISSAKPAAREMCAVRTAVNDAADALCRDLSKDGIRFRVHLDDPLTAYVDPFQLQQVLFNLFLNARKAMSSSHSGRLIVSGRREGERVVLMVKDTGEGIAPKLLPHIFEPLQSSKTAERPERSRCAGLGLALCRDLIEENGGTISVVSEPGVGTTFTIVLPANELSSA